MYRPLYLYITKLDSFNYPSLDNETMDIIRQNGVRNMYILKKLEEIVKVFSEHNISFIVMKGCHLIHQIYPFGVRPIEDIDLLVHPKDFNEVDRILKHLDYFDCAVSMETWVHEAFSNKITYQDHASPKIPVDIHFSLGPYPYLGRLSIHTIIENSEIIKGQTFSFRALKPEIMLIHLCLHAFSHIHENYQISCCDTISVINYHKGQINWELLLELLLKHKLTLPIKEVFKKVETLSKDTIPAKVMLALGKVEPNFIEKVIFRYSIRPLHEFEKHILQYLTTPGILKKIKIIPTFIYPGRRFLKVHYLGSYRHYIIHVLKLCTHFLKLSFKSNGIKDSHRYKLP